MSLFSQDNTLFPADATGKRLCEIFGRYRWKMIQADLPDDAKAKPSWHTIKKYEMRPRVFWRNWQDANTLIGVRFDHTTAYALLDIDAGSDYCTVEGVADIRAALETIGITRTLIVRSSWNGGLHLYMPLPEAVKTFDLAVTLHSCLKSQGFRILQGQLEIFPNIKAYGVATFIDYQAHRLPLQPGSGSCLLNDDLNPIDDSLARFFWRWDIAASSQAIDELHKALKIGRDNHRKKPKRRSHPVESWRQDLDTEITDGWTAHGQTNHLLKTIACYGRVFEGLEGQDLIDYTYQMAITRPGYQEWCRHQDEIQRKVSAWARAVENYYWPLGTIPTRDTTPPVNKRAVLNQQQADDAQQRIRDAYQALEEAGELPEQTTARGKALVKRAEVSFQTLYKYPALWHPAHISDVINDESSLSEEASGASTPPPAPPAPTEIEGLQPQTEDTKGIPPQGGEKGSDLENISLKRGVRGEKMSFPQAIEPLDPEVQNQMQRQMQILGWSYEKICQFVARHFDGRRWLELGNDERLLLLYYLQTVVP